MLTQKLQQKLLQKLSPQQILLMKLLQIPSIALEQRIKQEIEENPALEDAGDPEMSTDADEQIPDTEPIRLMNWNVSAMILILPTIWMMMIFRLTA